MSISEPQSLYNGFFPVGYAALLKVFPHGSEMLFAYVLNALFTGVLAAATALLLGASHGRIAAVAGFLPIVFQPLLFRYANTCGPDWGTAALSGLAVWLLWKNELREPETGPPLRHLVLAGFFLGLSALFRTHCLVSSLAVVLSFLLTRKTISKRHGALLVSFCTVLSVQVCTNLLSGHGAFETAQKFNIYKLVHGINWYHPPTGINETTLEILLHNRWKIAMTYVPGLGKLLLFAWPAILGSAFCRRPACSRFCLFAAVAVCMYAVPTALGGSSRAPLPITILYVVPMIMLIIDGIRRVTRTATATKLQKGLAVVMFAAVVGLASLQWLYADYALLLGWRRASVTYGKVEMLLKEAGMTMAKEVFTDSFDIYFKRTSTYRARANGGWGRYSLFGYSKQYPEIPTGSAGAFLSACNIHGVKFLVLTPQAGHLAPFLGELYANGPSEDAKEIVPLAQVAYFRVFALKHQPNNRIESDK